MRLPARPLGTLVAAALLAGCGAGPGSDVAATSGTVEISTAALAEQVRVVESAGQLADLSEDELPAARLDLQRDMLTQLLQVGLVSDLAEQQLGVVVTDDELDAAVEERQEQAGGAEALEEQLATERGNLELLRQNIEVQLLIQEIEAALVEANEVSDEQLQDAFDERDAQGQYEQATVRHILVETEQQAQDALARLEDGEDFGAVAQDVSIDPGSGAEGGSLGTAPRGTYVPEFEEVVWDEATPLGEVQGPVETQFGFHLIVVDERERQQLADVEEELREELQGAAVQPAFTAFLDEAFANEVEVQSRFGTWNPEQRAVLAGA